MRGRKIGIIGGGPGGLLTAYFLQHTANVPVRLTLIEASQRLGGKILTPRFNSLPANYEAGAAEFYDYSPAGEDPLKELIGELGLSISPIGGTAVIMNEQVLANLDDVRDHLGTAACRQLAAFDRVAKDWMSPQEYYTADGSANCQPPPAGPRFQTTLEKLLSGRARRYVECMIHSDLATEPAHTSGHYGLQNYLMNDPRYMHLYCIEGGNEQLPQQLAQRIDARKLLGHRVTDVRRNEEGQIAVTCALTNGATIDEIFDAVVVALPHDALSRVRFQGKRLASAMEEHRAHYHHPAHYLRISLLFERPFWREHLQESFCMLDCFGGCCLYDETSRIPGTDYGVLGWLVGGQEAQEMSAWKDESLMAAALDSLPADWGEGREWFREGRVHRWLNAVNAIPGGLEPRSLDLRHQPEPLEHPNLFVVGDYLFDSTLNGVLDSAEYVADWLAELLSET